MVPHQTSDSEQDRHRNHQGSPHETELPAMVSSSAHQNDTYNPYASARPLPVNIAAQRGGVEISSNIESFQMMNNTLLADYIRQAEEISRMLQALQQDMWAHSHRQPPTDPRYDTTWVSTPAPTIPYSIILTMASQQWMSGYLQVLDRISGSPMK
jgi:hypothetical protein